METDKRPLYIWIVVLLANIGMALDLILFNIYENRLIDLQNFIPLIIFLLMTTVPVLISRSNNRLKNHFGYGIPILLLIPLPYFVYDVYTCTSMFCGIVPIILGLSFGLSAIIFALFYAMDKYFRKWNVKFVLTLIWIEVILILGSALCLGINILNRYY